eukprot:TRINITY_DN3861_c0_g2_i2.p1 TRINITY_DN3861_c0_g2~~TRINITY_DN3861_c0_g2_i2.p1  ORF type:complete len:342 (+),score=26.50 TRINITY_DN3861_c0_g2_i2:65-1090(+)
MCIRDSVCNHMTDFSILGEQFDEVISNSNIKALGKTNEVLKYNILQSKTFWVITGLGGLLSLLMIWGNSYDLTHNQADVTVINMKKHFMELFRAKRKQARARQIAFNSPKSNSKSKPEQPSNVGLGTILTDYVQFLKISHPFISILSVYDLKLSRPSRFFMYFVRILSMFSGSILFFTGSKPNYSIFQKAVIAVICLFGVIPANVTLMLLLKHSYPSGHPAQSRDVQTAYSYHLRNNIHNDEKFRKPNFKKAIGVVFGGLYAILCFYTIFSVEASFSEETKALWLETYLSSFALDFVVVRMIRGIFNITLVLYLGGSTAQVGFCAQVVLKFLDKNVAYMVG